MIRLTCIGSQTAAATAQFYKITRQVDTAKYGRFVIVAGKDRNTKPVAIRLSKQRNIYFGQSRN